MIPDSRNKDRFPYLETAIILDACDGKREAQTEVIENYRKYIRNCLRKTAFSSYHMHLEKQDMEELEQRVIVDALEAIWAFKPL